jgi:hypothetical protein
VNAGRASLNAKTAPINADITPEDDNEATVDPVTAPAKSGSFQKNHIALVCI